MTLKELRESIDLALSFQHDSEKNEVVITLVEPSVGGRANSKVRCAVNGFDWEKGQFRIEPVEELVRKGRDLKTAIPAKERLSFDKTCTVFRCPICDGKINKNDYFCRFCGQKLKER